MPLGAGAPPAPASLAFTPTTSAGTYDFGTLAVGATASQTFTLRNSGGQASGALTISLTGTAVFTKTADGCSGISIGGGKSCNVTVQYSPSGAAASDAAQLNATNKKKEPTTASLALTGTVAVSGHIYWANFSSNTISRSNLDGTGVNQSFITGVSGAQGVAVG